MPIRYAIEPDLNFLVYVFEGDCSAKDYFEMYNVVYLDERRHHGMRVLVDMSTAILDIDTSSLRQATAIVAKNNANGFLRDHVAILTKGTSLRFLKDAFITIADNLPMDLDIFHNFHDAARWLGLVETEVEAMQFWEACLQSKA
jgi:hypothetical protein